MTNPVAEFFGGLQRQAAGLLPSSSAGSIRFELSRDDSTDQWRVRIDRGGVTVSRGDGPADCVVFADQNLFQGIVSGRVNAIAALLRGALRLEGDPELLVLIQRLFPGPSRSKPSEPSRPS